MVVVLSISASAGASKLEKGKKHDLSKAQVMDRTILAIMESYYDPDRVDTKKMFKSALDTIQLNVAEIKVDFSKDGETAIIEISGKRMKVAMNGVGSPWGLSRAMRRVFRFMVDNLPAEDRDYLTLEYVAVNGLLSVLDPHSSVMMPDLWEELRMSTRGEFEGVGIRITTDRRPPCDGDLTVVEVFKNTPAMRAGMRKGDKIIKIDGDSTVNITTSEAAERLRGTPDTKVRVQVKRLDGTIDKLLVSRGKIAIESVESKMLDGNVGYITLETFQRNSADEIRDTLHSLRAKKMKGLILDLRGNPGGLLDSAIKVADLFVSSGTIVTTAGRQGDVREVENASVAGTEPLYPLVIMIDSFSASAAEVLAGALRNHGRALLIGETSFGKGSVQAVLPLPGGGALRLTIAQYLTPGDISIQAVGVAPDIRFWPAIVDREEMHLDVGGPGFSEADLDSHLVRPNAMERGDSPGAIEVMTFLPASRRKADSKMWERCYPEGPDRESFMSGHKIEFARRLIANARGVTTSELILEAGEIVEKEAHGEEAALLKALKKMGIDWTSVRSDNANLDPKMVEDPAITATAQILGNIKPGGKFKIKVTVKNGTGDTISRLRAVTKSDNHLLSGLELVFGQVKKNRSKKWAVVVDLPRILARRSDPVEISFFSESGRVPRPISIDVAMPIVSHPVLSYRWHLEDLGNGNGFVEPGEDLLMSVVVENVGDVATFDVDANLSAKPGINVKQGHFRVGKLAPGKSAHGVFRLQLADRYNLDEAQLHLALEEWVPSKFPIARGLIDHKIILPVSPMRPKPSRASGSVTVVGDRPVPLYSVPLSTGRIAGRVKAGATFKVDGRQKGFFRMVLEEDRHAWIAESSTRPGGNGRPDYELSETSPPRIFLDGGFIRKTGEKTARISGYARHPEGLRDLIVLVGGKKVAYLPNKRGADNDRIAFSVDVPLEDGANQILIAARHDKELVETESVFVRKESR